MFGEITKKQLELNHKKQQEEMKARQEKLNTLTKELLTWFEEKGLTLGETVNVLQALDESFKKEMQRKTLPIVKDFNARPLKDFYAVSEAAQDEARSE